MKLYEHQGKALLGQYGIPVPQGILVDSADRAEAAAGEIGGSHWMVKAQVLAGGRGKGHFAGSELSSGVQRADSLTNVQRFASVMIGRPLVTRQTGADGETVTGVYIEQAVSSEQEFSMAVLVDVRLKKLVLLYSRHGGKNIEAVAERDPQAIHKTILDQDDGLSAADLARVCENLGLDSDRRGEVGDIIAAMHRLFTERDASLVEVNPLALTADGLVALDAKLVLDDNASFRQPGNRDFEDQQAGDGRRQASRDGFNYFPMPGNIGCLAAGAGLAMATIDALKYLGGEPANFLDLPPDSQVSRSCAAIELLVRDPRVKSVLVNVYGGGIMRCDTIADALLMVNRTRAIQPPLVVRLAGTNAELAIRRLRESLPDVHLAGNLAQAASLSVDLAAGRGQSASAESVSGRSWSGKLRGLLSGRGDSGGGR